jgi:hypothetical protein
MNIKAYRYDPSNLQTIEWLGSYYIDSQYPEKAVEYFEKAALGRYNSFINFFQLKPK